MTGKSMKRKTVAFKITGSIRVGKNVTDEQVREWLSCHYDIDGTCDGDNPLLEDYEAEDSIELDDVDIL